MPYRHTHWWMAALLAPLIVVAFWSNYFAVLPTASLAFHAHGISASAWLALLALQSWSAHTRRWPLHRASGRAVFVVVPLFALGGTLAIFSMAGKFAGRTNPFYAMLGARLGMLDLVVSAALVGLVALALYRRRQIAFHAACMIATALMVLPPVIGRLPVPQIPHMGDAIVIVLALWLASRQAKGRAPFLFVAALQALQVVLFRFVATQAWWEEAFAALAPMNPWPFAIAAAFLALAALVAGWRAGTPAPRKPRPGRPDEAEAGGRAPLAAGTAAT